MYLILKLLLACGIIICSTRIGILISKKYKYRLDELDELKSQFKLIENKIKYTYCSLEDIFAQVAEISEHTVKELFLNVAKNIKKDGAQKAWTDAIDVTTLNIKREDKQVLKEFGTLLGKTNKEGQLNQIKYQIELLDRQIEKAKREKEKNENVYQKLGLIFGIGISIIFI